MTILRIADQVLALIPRHTFILSYSTTRIPALGKYGMAVKATMT